MIQDAARVTLSNGDCIHAIDCNTGKEVLSLSGTKITRDTVVAQTTTYRQDIVGLVLSTGQRLCGSLDQRVAVLRDKVVRFLPLSEIEVGMTLRGEASGLPVNVRVLGTLHYPHKDVRVVQFVTKHQKPFIAEGILCRS